MKNIPVTKIYRMLLVKHTAIQKVDGKFINLLQKREDEYNKSIGTAKYILAVFTLLLVFGIYPSVFAYLFSIAKSWEIQFSTILNLRSLIEKHSELIIAIGLVLFAIPLYTFFLLDGFLMAGSPKTKKSELEIFLDNILARFQDNKDSQTQQQTFLTKVKKLQNFLDKRINKEVQKTKNMIIVDRKSFSFILFVSLLYYFAFLIIISLGYTYSEFISIKILSLITTLWIMLPLILISLIPVFLWLLTGTFFLTLYENQKDKSADSDLIVIELLHLIHDIDIVDNNKYVDLESRKDIANTINKISYQMRKFYTKTSSQNALLNWADKKMNRVADSFQSLGTIVLFPSESNLSILLPHIYLYLNSFLTNNYKDLPQEPCENLDSFVKTKEWGNSKVYYFVALVLYMIFPIFMTGILISSFEIKIEPLLQTFLNILYGAWILFGAIYFSEKISPEFRKTLIEIFGLMLPNR